MGDRKRNILLLVLSVAAWLLSMVWCRQCSPTRPTSALLDSMLVSDSIEYDTIVTFQSGPPFSISPYDHLFKQYADSIGWNWKWLAAISYYESHFNCEAMNATGAAGLMQVMPQTAASMGVDTTIYRTDPRENIKAAARLFKRLDKMFHYVAMPDRVCFVLAAYNAGHGHVIDAVNLAEKYGCNKKQWYGNVEFFMGMQNDPKYYNDSVCRNGRFNGTETINFVKNVSEKYQEYARLEHLYYSINRAEATIVTRPKNNDNGNE